MDDESGGISFSFPDKTKEGLAAVMHTKEHAVEQEKNWAGGVKKNKKPISGKPSSLPATSASSSKLDTNLLSFNSSDDVQEDVAVARTSSPSSPLFHSSIPSKKPPRNSGVQVRKDFFSVNTLDKDQFSIMEALIDICIRGRKELEQSEENVDVLKRFNFFVTNIVLFNSSYTLNFFFFSFSRQAEENLRRLTVTDTERHNGRRPLDAVILDVPSTVPLPPGLDICKPSLLHLAAMCGNVEFANILLQVGANVNLSDPEVRKGLCILRR